MFENWNWENPVETCKSKKDGIMKTFNLTEKEFLLVLYWFENEPDFDGTEEVPVRSIKDIDKKEGEGNYVVTSTRFAMGVEFARQGGFDLKETNTLSRNNG